MFLTGFDSKYLNTLYIDKNLKQHGLIQAFSRTNRILNPTKPYGNIIDFRGHEAEFIDKFKDAYVPNFYKGYFENNFHGKQLKKFITSGARMDGLLNIKPSDFFSIVLPTPKDKKEQQ